MIRIPKKKTRIQKQKCPEYKYKRPDTKKPGKIFNIEDLISEY
jgi:hypothetical protein